MKHLIAVFAVIFASCLVACHEKPVQAIGLMHMTTPKTDYCKFLIMPV